MDADPRESKMAIRHHNIASVYTMFYYKDLAAAASWYETKLGFRRVISVPGAEIFEITPYCRIALVADGSGSQRAIEGRQKGAILSLETDELAEWHAELFRRGVEGTGIGAQTGADGRTIEFKVYDPGGYTVEFFEWIE